MILLHTATREQLAAALAAIELAEAREFLEAAYKSDPENFEDGPPTDKSIRAFAGEMHWPNAGKGEFCEMVEAFFEEQA